MSTRATTLIEVEAEEAQRGFLWLIRTWPPTEPISNPLWSVFPNAKLKVELGHGVAEVRYRTWAECPVCDEERAAKADAGTVEPDDIWTPWWGGIRHQPVMRWEGDRAVRLLQIQCCLGGRRRHQPALR